MIEWNTGLMEYCLPAGKAGKKLPTVAAGS